MYDDEDFDADEAARDERDNYIFDVAHDKYGLAGMKKGLHRVDADNGWEYAIDQWPWVK